MKKKINPKTLANTLKVYNGRTLCSMRIEKLGADSPNSKFYGTGNFSILFRGQEITYNVLKEGIELEDSGAASFKIFLFRIRRDDIVYAGIRIKIYESGTPLEQLIIRLKCGVELDFIFTSIEDGNGGYIYPKQLAHGNIERIPS